MSLTPERIAVVFKDIFGFEPSHQQMVFAKDVCAGRDVHYIHGWDRRTGRTSIQLAVAVAYALASGRRVDFIAERGQAATLRSCLAKIQYKIGNFRVIARSDLTSYSVCFYDHAIYEQRHATLMSELKFIIPGHLVRDINKHDKWRVAVLKYGATEQSIKLDGSCT